MIILFLLPRNVYYISHCSDTNIKNNTIYTRILQRSEESKDQNRNITVNIFMDWQG